jgi:hypothetical protein
VRVRSAQDTVQPVEAWGERGVFLRMMEGPAAAETVLKTVMVDAPHLKIHRPPLSLRVEKGTLAADSPHQRRHEHQAARRQRCGQAPLELLYDPPGRSATILTRQPCSTTCRRRTGCSGIAAMMPTGSGMPWKPKAYSPASQAADRATSRSDTTSGATGGPQPHRDHVRSPERLAPRRYSLRPMPDGVLLRHRPSDHRHLLAIACV